MRNPVFRVSDQVRHKSGCTAAEDCYWLEILDLGRGTIYVAKTKALISCTVTAQLICAFVFTYAKIGFLMAQLISKRLFFVFLCKNLS